MNIFTPFFVSALSMAPNTLFSLVFGICLYATYWLILNAHVRENVPCINEVSLPDIIPYDHVQIADRFIFDREGDALIYETYLDRLQMWIRRNRFRPLTCLQGNRGDLLFQQQTVERPSRNILVELFSVDRETRLKELLRCMCYHIDEQDTVTVARSIMFIFSSNLGIKIVGDGPNEFEEVLMAIFHALCTSQNLFVCDFMLLYLTSSANVGDIIATFSLNELLWIDTYNEDAHVGNLFNQPFMNHIQWKPGFPNLFGYNNRQSIAFRRAAADVLRDIQLFQTILTNIPNDFEINGNVNGDIPGNNNGGIYDENRREIERLRRIERMDEIAAVRNEDEDIEEGILAWFNRTVLGGAEIVIPRVAYTDVERERIWAFLITKYRCVVCHLETEQSLEK
ncbi:hypothetical protein EDC94DRAFT_595008 [Helicostylum pulchrum]|nr:hypothetical protein EDC94DRAFT_595008 [Helicostylum pulchrum]